MERDTGVLGEALDQRLPSQPVGEIPAKGPVQEIGGAEGALRDRFGWIAAAFDDGERLERGGVRREGIP